jgi:hypothetical protein
MDQASFGGLAEQIHSQVLDFRQFRIEPGFVDAPVNSRIVS